MTNASQQNSSRGTIYIDLTASESAGVMDKDPLMQDADPLIQQEAIKAVRNIISTHLSRVEPFLAQRPGTSRLENTSASHPFYSRVHNTIGVMGERGSGKTTFLINLLEQIKNESRIEVLRIIDPTLMEDREHILIGVISSIKRCVEAKYRNQNEGSEEDYKQWWNSLKQLAHGLHLLKPGGWAEADSEDWGDAQWALEQGLKNARTGADLEWDFRQYVGQSLRLIGTERGAFLLAFDDIDTSFERGWPVLEVIRKYLTSPQLIILLSGDLSLYSKLVRRHQFKNLGPELLENDRPTRDRHPETALPGWEQDPWKETVDRLEDQYLMKILQPQNRVSLLTLGFYQRELPGYDLFVKAPERKRLQEFLDEKIKVFFALSSTAEGLEQFRTAVVDQPLRTAIQILRAANTQDRKAFLDTLTDIAASALFHTNLRPEDIKMGDGSTLLWIACKWLTRQDQWDEGYRLLPNYRDNESNLIALVLGGQLARQIQLAPFVAIQQMLALGMTRELVVMPWNPDALVKATPPTPIALFDYLGIQLKERSFTTGRRLVNALRTKRAGQTASQPFYGTIPVRGGGARFHLPINSLYGQKFRLGDAQSGFKRLVDTPMPGTALHLPIWIAPWFTRVVVSSGRPTAEGIAYNTRKTLARQCGEMDLFVNLAASNMPDASGSETEYFSIFNLLGAAAEFMALAATGGSDQASLLDRVEGLLRRLGEIRTYPRPPWAKVNPTAVSQEDSDVSGDGQMAEEDSQNSSEPPTNADTYMKFRDALVAWIDKVAASVGMYHPHVYARMTTRFFYTLTSIDTAVKPKDWYTGHLLHRQIVALLNAILVEERLARGLTQSLQRDNPTEKDTNFYDNLRTSCFVKKASANTSAPNDFLNSNRLDPNVLPFFCLIASCPLWALYVRPEVEIRASQSTATQRPTTSGSTWKFLEFLVNLWTPCGS